MSERFRAILIDKSDKAEKGQAFRFAEMTEPELMAGDVTIAVEHSSVNYKDGLAITAKAPIVRRFPLIPGIDLAGVVISSTHDAFTCRRSGDPQWLGHRRDPSWRLCPARPRQGRLAGRHAGDPRFSPRHGNRHRWLHCHARGLGARGPWRASRLRRCPGHRRSRRRRFDAIVLLAGLGYRVVASTGRLAEEPYLRSLGAAAVVDRSEFAGPVKPLAKSRFAGAINSVGSTTLANVLSQIDYGGTVAACGLAQGMDLPGSVAPFILRAVTLAGINSVMCPVARRQRAWSRLARDLDLKKLGVITSQVPLDDVPLIAEEIVAGKVRGRVVVDL